MPTYLDRIGAWHRDVASHDTRDLSELAEEALASPSPRGFREALTSARASGDVDGSIAIIAEIKRRSPSKGDIAPDLDPGEVARAYAAGGASCLSVLTDGPHFGGSRADLESARAAVGLPVLRKDFTVSAADVYDTRIMGADAVLLIVALLGQLELAELLGVSTELYLDALVEVHDEAELVRALEVGATMIGVNQRDLHTFEIDSQRARTLVANIPPGVVKLAESGVNSPLEVAELARSGFDAVLVGESLLRSHDRQAAVCDLLGRTTPCG